MDMRIFMATQGNHTSGFRVDLSTKKGKRFDYEHDGIETRTSALEGILSELNNINLDEIKVPVQIFTNDHLYKNIVNGYYKYWILTGKTQEGEKVNEEEISLWEMFSEMYSQHNLKIIIKSTSEAKISERLKSMEGKYATKGRNKGKKIEITGIQKFNDKYSALVWEWLKETVGDSELVIEEDFSIAQ